MGQHDNYGRNLLEQVAMDIGAKFEGPTRHPYESGGWADLDGMLKWRGSSIVVEVESRTGKQVRGALLDLVLHPSPYKLLILVDAGKYTRSTPSQCDEILRHFCTPTSFSVITLSGNGDKPIFEEDRHRIRQACESLVKCHRPLPQETSTLGGVTKA